MHWKNRIPAKRYRSLVELNDLPRTLLDLSGLPPYEGMQGESLAPLLGGGTCGSRRESVFCEYLNAMPWHTNPKAFASMVRTEHYKLVAAHSAGSGELYDLRKDPGEHENRYYHREYQGIKVELLERLLNHWSRTADPLPVRKSAW
jgi:arylsulfatase A-like enzyme